jgi:glutathione S-transferase
MSNVPNRLESSRAQRLLVLLEELNLKYEIKTYKRNKDALAPQEMKNIHPLGKSPSVEIEIHGQAPFVLAESGAIFEYLCDHFGKRLIPPRVNPELEGKIGAETEEFRRNRYFMHYAEGSLMSLLAIAAVMLSELYPENDGCIVIPSITTIGLRLQRRKTSKMPLFRFSSSRLLA